MQRYGAVSWHGKPLAVLLSVLELRWEPVLVLVLILVMMPTLVARYSLMDNGRVASFVSSSLMSTCTAG